LEDEMILITLRSQINRILEFWKYQYPHMVRGDGKYEIYQKLKRLNLKTASPQEVRDIIGNYSWACQQKCNECGESFDEVVAVGDETSIYLCKYCLEKARMLFPNWGLF
jgi:hypothetical protein